MQPDDRVLELLIRHSRDARRLSSNHASARCPCLRGSAQHTVHEEQHGVSLEHRVHSDAPEEVRAAQVMHSGAQQRRRNVATHPDDCSKARRAQQLELRDGRLIVCVHRDVIDRTINIVLLLGTAHLDASEARQPSQQHHHSLSHRPKDHRTCLTGKRTRGGGTHTETVFHGLVHRPR